MKKKQITLHIDANPYQDGSYDIMKPSNEALMCSLEVAELTGKRHDNLIFDIEKMLIELNIGALDFQGSYKSKQGKKTKCYFLPKRECIILVTGYNVNMRAAIVDRWQELEGSTPKLPQTLPDALRLAANLAEQNLILTPKAKALDRLSNASGSYSLRDTAKQLKVKPTFLNKWLEAHKWCFKNGEGKYVPYQRHIESGLMIVISCEANGRSFIQTKVTTKGITKLSIVFQGGD